MIPEPPEMPKFPRIDVLPLVDRVVSAGLWVGRLFTKQVLHEPTPISDHFQEPLFDSPDHAPQHIQDYCQGRELE